MSYRGPVVLAILDGVGLAPASRGNAVAQAHLEFLGQLSEKYLSLALAASGEAVGILPGQMGNSEVGHNALGSGQIIKQGIARIEEAFATGEIWQSEAWTRAMAQILSPDTTKENADLSTEHTLHFAGIFSDGGVHSDISHLERMIVQAYSQGVRRIRIHCVFDGRDVPPQSEPKFIDRIEQFCAQFTDADFRIADGAGRMVATADRYESNWPMVKKGWDLMIHGRSSHQFSSAKQAIAELRAAGPSVQDQYLPDFVIVGANGEPVGQVRQGDAMIYFDFRADRAIEIAEAFTYLDFPYFDRGQIAPALGTTTEPVSARDAIAAGQLFFAGLTEYNSDTHVPQYRLVPPVTIHDTLNQFLGANQKTQLAVSETVKYGHVTYYFNGNSYDPAPGEAALEIPSDTRPFNTRPWMKSAEITDAALEELANFDFVRINFPGGDMVGHFGELEPTIAALEAIDIQLRRLAEKVDELGGLLIITADHGNAEAVADPETGEPKTAHTTNLVPCIFYDNTENRTRYAAAPVSAPGLANLAATVAFLLGLEQVPATWEPSLLQRRDR